MRTPGERGRRERGRGGEGRGEGEREGEREREGKGGEGRGVGEEEGIETIFNIIQTVILHIPCRSMQVSREWPRKQSQS